MDSAAAVLGRRLLDEVHEEGLDELLHDLRTQHLSPNDNGTNHPVLGVKYIDDLLDIFLNRGSAPCQGPSTADHSSSESPTVPRLSSSRSQQYKLPVLEISSPNSGGGKSQLVYYLAAVSVLPSTFKGRTTGGRDGAVVLLDTDGKLEVKRLYQIAEGVVWNNLRANLKVTEETTTERVLSEQDIKSLLHDSLQHVHIFRPQTSLSLLATLKTLGKYLLDVTRHHSATRPLHAILLDSASAFYWQDRMRDEVARTEEIGRSAADITHDREQRKKFHMSVLYRELVVELRRIQSIFDCSIIYTTWGLFRAPSDRNVAYAHLWAGPPSFKPHLPSPWGTFPTLRLVVQRDAVRSYPVTATLKEMERDAPIRQGVVRQGKFSAWIDTWGKDDWPPAVLSALRNMPENGGFPFWIRADGVFMDDLMADVI
ncbi:hypothetical protein BGW36DRAFT_362051 [Talaromyces proteolyticus]|uniref:DNA recombination and repair protein Rad51-like C-terminal domain-containing protein n=1 Tax=Talaromyces proteolyticus TaxID=1131652 RepID=A0AAD4KNG2_9EURO|nr:uncharacterized protein BGW36DRAFT_362051 [Talaromyces proteolyticus]KAH8694235.1 hypothetical protein BGW36DRAFT_362051 [Talaromyces proteolyticus]